MSSLAVDASAAVRRPAPKPAPKPVRYKNCTELNKKFPHGVARRGAKDKVRGRAKPVTTFTVNAQWYAANIHLDADKDGVACEKK